MNEDAQQDGSRDNQEHLISFREVRLLQYEEAKEDRRQAPRPEPAEVEDAWSVKLVPTKDNATGTMRTMVRLRTAYSMTRQPSSPSAGPAMAAPKNRKVSSASNFPSSSAKS